MLPTMPSPKIAREILQGARWEFYIPKTGNHAGRLSLKLDYSKCQDREAVRDIFSSLSVIHPRSTYFGEPKNSFYIVDNVDDILEEVAFRESLQGAIPAGITLPDPGDDCEDVIRDIRSALHRQDPDHFPLEMRQSEISDGERSKLDTSTPPERGKFVGRERRMATQRNDITPSSPEHTDAPPKGPGTSKKLNSKQGRLF